LACGRAGCSCRRNGNVHCPAHADRDPSLSVGAGRDDAIVVRCHAGCTQDAVIAALRSRGLWPSAPARVAPSGLTVRELADAKRLPIDFLRSLGVADGTVGRERGRAVVIPYCDAGGAVVAERRRLRLTGEPRFIWRRGDHALPYGLARLADARRAGGPVLIVEGESDSWTLWHAGIDALGVPGANTWRDDWAEHLAGLNVYVWHEPDAGGDALVAKVSASLPDVRVVEAPPGLKDASSMWLDCGGSVEGFRERLRALMAAARPASELRAETAAREARAAFDQARGLLDKLDIIAHIEAALRAAGYAGDATPALLCYLALTSRLLDRPINLALVAQSASGKSFALDTARALFPPEAYHLERAGSARALVYSDADFEHKTVIVSEADSLPEDGPAAAAIRSLAADNVMEYDVVERDERTGRWGV